MNEWMKVSNGDDRLLVKLNGDFHDNESMVSANCQLLG